MITAVRSSSRMLLRGSFQFCKRLSRNESGAMSVLIAIGLTVLLGFAALGVDVSLWLRAKNDAQLAADAAASSAAAAGNSNASKARATAEAVAAAAAAGFINGTNGVVVTMNNPPASGAYAGNGNAYEAIVTAPQKVYLASIMPSATAPTVQGRAVALLSRGSAAPTFNVCILGLSPQPSNVDVTFNGNTVVTANGCDVDADSPSSSSINTNGGGQIHAANIRTVGGVSGGNFFVTGQIYTQQSTIPDPYSGMKIPSPTSTSLETRRSIPAST